MANKQSIPEQTSGPVDQETSAMALSANIEDNTTEAAAASTGSPETKCSDDIGVDPQEASLNSQVEPNRDQECAFNALTTEKFPLEKYVPAKLVVDYHRRDRRAVKITCIPEGTTEEDIQAICQGTPQVRIKTTEKGISFAFVVLKDEQSAIDTARELDGFLLNGRRLRARHFASRWSDPASCPLYIAHTIDVRQIPVPARNKESLAQLFPGGKVLEVDGGGFARIGFESDEQLVAAMTELKERNFGGYDLRFAMSVLSQGPQPVQVPYIAE